MSTIAGFVTLQEFVVACIEKKRLLSPKDLEGFYKFFGADWVEKKYNEGKSQENSK